MVEQRCNSNKEFKCVCLTDLEIVVPTNLQDPYTLMLCILLVIHGPKSVLDKLSNNRGSLA